MEDLKKKVENQVRIYTEMAVEIYGKELDIPRVLFSQKGQCAGRASSSSWAVNFNMELLKENEEDFLQNTVPHEVAHLVNWALFRGRGHGKSWKKVMVRLGLTPDRCHSYDTTRVVSGGAFIYKCACSEHVFSKRRHNSVRRGRIYTCRTCGAILEFVRVG